MKPRLWPALLGIAVAAGITLSCAQTQERKTPDGTVAVHTDSVPKADADARYRTLTDEDFRIVAEELGVETAAIKAVVSIEAGPKMEGFWAPGIPIVNFDRTMYNKYASKVPSKAGAKDEKVPAGLTGYALREWTQLINARKVNAMGANMGTFWGMFQIGGFCYKLCGCSSVNEMVRLMSRSELDQLELFAAFLKNTGYVTYLKNRNWAEFSRRYNGPGYAKRGYHTKMAKAYAKFKAQAQGAPKGSDGSVNKSLKAAPGETNAEE